MSKKNFAKKFVAYTMAFAVAFGTVNVSPIFVKEAQAAGAGIVTYTLTAATNKVGDGKILYVSKNIDINTGLISVRTSGVSDGLQFAEFSAHPCHTALPITPLFRKIFPVGTKKYTHMQKSSCNLKNPC